MELADLAQVRFVCHPNIFLNSGLPSTRYHQSGRKNKDYFDFNIHVQVFLKFPDLMVFPTGRYARRRQLDAGTYSSSSTRWLDTFRCHSSAAEQQATAVQRIESAATKPLVFPFYRCPFFAISCYNR